MGKIYNELMSVLGPDAFIKGLNYNAKYVLFERVDDTFNRKCFFKVRSERTSELYSVVVEIDFFDQQVVDFKCDCPQYERAGVCKHIGAAMLKYSDVIFSDEDLEISNYALDVSHSILNAFYKPKYKKIRKKLNVHLSIVCDYTYSTNLCVGLKIGLEHLYTLNNKFSRFMEAYKNEETFPITAKFAYNSQEYYFGSSDKKILDFFAAHNNHSLFGEIFSKNEIHTLMNLFADQDFYINGLLYHGVVKANPLKTRFFKEENYYKLEFSNIGDWSLLLAGKPYIYNNVCLYELPSRLSKLFSMLVENEIDTLIFEDKDLKQFTENILPIVKDCVSIDESVGNFVINVKPKCQLFFDFYYKAIECKVIFVYDDVKVNVFDNSEEIVRDNELESNIFERLGEIGFVADEGNKRFLLEEIDLIGEFLETELSLLSSEYEVFTSKKIRETEIKKDMSCSANFSIGSDNIMSYEFELDGVDSSELASLIDSMRAKKKYYRVKSGDLINLSQNSALSNIERLAFDMDLSSKELAGGEIPKYRAIYYDCLCRNKYKGLITTNNLFDELVKRFKAYKNESIVLADSEEKILRDYQKIGVKWLYNIYKCGFGGILADEMGLGKSIQLIYLIKLIVRESPLAKILIVAPTSLVYNWKKEFDKFGRELNYEVFAENREERLSKLSESKGVNIFITTYGLVRNDVEVYKDICFNLIAIDEAQNIKNAQTKISKAVKCLKADVKVALTGTPLENSVMELWSIFDFIMPGYLADNKKFKALYNINSVDEESLRKLDNLNLQINNFILRRKKEDVAKELPAKIENNIYVELGQQQRKLYAGLVLETKKEMDEIISSEGFNKARFKILKLITRLRQVCIDPGIIFDNYNGGRAKIDTLVDLVLSIKANGRKVLIFTTYKTALDVAIKELNNVGVSTYYIDGSVPSSKRVWLVDKFNNDDTDAFLITLKAGGTGLNLTAATVVIHLDLWWNPQVENQATDRAHRIGQTKTVEVIRLVASGTIEERILELQDKKRKLADALIEGDLRDKNQLSNLTEKDIELLFSMDNEGDVYDKNKC